MERGKIVMLLVDENGDYITDDPQGLKDMFDDRKRHGYEFTKAFLDEAIKADKDRWVKFSDIKDYKPNE